MLGKLLITVMVAAGVYLWWRHNRSLTRAATPLSKITSNVQTKEHSKKQKGNQSPLRFVFFLVLGSFFILTLAWQVYNWRAGYSIMQVTLTNTHTATESSFLVYQKDLHTNSFTTIDGQLIRLAANERMLVQRKLKSD